MRRLGTCEWGVIVALGAGTCVCAAAACGPGNSGHRPIDTSLIEAVPWTNGGTPVLEGGAPVIPVFPEFPPIATGMPDPGSGPVDCGVLDNVQTSNGYYDSFEAAPGLQNGVGAGLAWTGFDDRSWGSFRAPGDATWYTGHGSAYQIGCVPPRCDGGAGQSVWGLAAVPEGGPSCNGVPNHWSLHYRGGLFTVWGGGISSVFTDPVGSCDPSLGICPPPLSPDAAFDTAGLPTSPSDGYDAGPFNGYDQSHAFVDASAWDGVGFWARTGPEGNPQIILTITDSFTSDRLARQNQKYCRRLRQCYTRCLSGTPCTPEPDPNTPASQELNGNVYRCFDPDSGVFPSASATTISSATGVPALMDLLYPRCGPSACTSPQTYLDHDFDGKQCRAYTFPAGDITGEYCWNPNDLPPPDRHEQCLDGWATAVTATLDWRYYKVPFSQLRQGGFGKVAPYLNLHAIDTIAFTVIVGWADFFVDNVSFYRITN